VLCKHDFTFRRYNGPEELETPGKKPPRVYKMSEIEYVAQVRARGGERRWGRPPGVACGVRTTPTARAPRARRARRRPPPARAHP